MKTQLSTAIRAVSGGKKVQTIVWNLLSELIGFYFWLLKFSNVLLKLVQ